MVTLQLSGQTMPATHGRLVHCSCLYKTTMPATHGRLVQAAAVFRAAAAVAAC